MAVGSELAPEKGNMFFCFCSLYLYYSARIFSVNHSYIIIVLQMTENVFVPTNLNQSTSNDDSNSRVFQRTISAQVTLNYIY